MEEFKLGRVPYLMTLIWTAICWQVFSNGSVGLIFEVSTLFSDVISTLGLPVVPVLAVVFFNDKMSGVKVISMGLCGALFHMFTSTTLMTTSPELNQVIPQQISCFCPGCSPHELQSFTFNGVTK
ncbi:hypothetical protein SLE2022_387840 [Rubroshorea leprosula]